MTTGPIDSAEMRTSTLYLNGCRSAGSPCQSSMAMCAICRSQPHFSFEAATIAGLGHVSRFRGTRLNTDSDMRLLHRNTSNYDGEYPCNRVLNAFEISNAAPCYVEVLQDGDFLIKTTTIWIFRSLNIDARKQKLLRLCVVRERTSIYGIVLGRHHCSARSIKDILVSLTTCLLSEPLRFPSL